MFDPATLNELLREHGRFVTFRRYDTEAYDPLTGSVTKTNTDYTVRVQFYNDVPEMTDNTSKDNTPVAFGSKRAVISNTLANGQPTPRPQLQDLIMYPDGDSSAITKVSPITSNSQVVCYIVFLDE